MKTAKRYYWLLFLCVFSTLNLAAAEKIALDIHGYLSQGFLYSNHNNYMADTETGSFQFNELGLNVATDVTDKLGIGFQLAARDLGDLGDDKIIVDWAYADYRWKDWFGLRVGKIKIPIGLYNKSRDVDMLRTWILLPQSIYSETFRDNLTAIKGIGIYGDVSLKTLGDILYQGQLGTMEIDKESSTTKMVESMGWLKIDRYKPGKIYSWAITWEPPLQGLRLGVSQAKTDLKTYANITEDLTRPVSFPPYTITIAKKGTPMIIDTPVYRKTIYSLEFTWKELVLAAEYGSIINNMINRIPDREPTKRNYEMEILYGSASYRFNPWFEAGLYYSLFYKDRNDRDGSKTPYNPPFNAYQKDACLALRFDPNDHWTIKLEGHLMDGTGLCFTLDNLDDNGVLKYTKNWYLLAAKMTFSF